MIGRLTGILSTSVLPEDDREALLEKIPFLYQGEGQEMHEYLMDLQLCPITQLARFSNKAVDMRLNEVMANERL